MELEKLAQSIPLEGQQPAAGRRRGRHRAHRVSPAQTRMDLREVNCELGAFQAGGVLVLKEEPCRKHHSYR